MRYIRNLCLLAFLTILISGCLTLETYPSDKLSNSKIRKYPERRNFYFHDPSGEVYLGQSTSISDSSYSSIINREDRIVSVPLASAPRSMHDDIHIYSIDTLPGEKDAKVELKHRNIREIGAYRELVSSPIVSKNTTLENDKTTNNDKLSSGESAGISFAIILLIIAAATASVLLTINALFGGCYIATMAYGSYSAPEVMVLRRFRDEKLKKTLFGKILIGAYYAVSPSLVKLLQNVGFINRFIRKRLDHFVGQLKTKNNW